MEVSTDKSRKFGRIAGAGALVGTLFLAIPAAVGMAQDSTNMQTDSMPDRQLTRDSAALADSLSGNQASGQQPDVENPTGYAGMERPVNVFPPDSAGTDRSTSPGAVEDRVTGTYEDSAWKDTTGAAQNPAGYRGMERPAGLDSVQMKHDSTSRKAAQKSQPGKKSKAAQKTQAAKKTKPAATKQDTTGQQTQKDSVWGRSAERDPEVQNPPGYRGMERPVNVFPPDSGPSNRPMDSSAVEDRVTGTYEDSAWKDTTGAAQNPAGYRGMERPASLDSTNAQTDSSSAQPETRDDTGAKGEASKADNNGRTSNSGGDESSTVRAGPDSTGDSTRFEVNSQETR